MADETKEVAKVENRQIARVEYNEFKDFNDLEKFGAYAQELLKAGFGNHTTKQGIMASWLWANDHGFPVMDCIAHLTNINGKVGADSHLIKAMIQRANIIDETIYDWKPLYEYSYKDQKFSQDDIEANPNAFHVCYSMPQIVKVANDESITAMPVLRSATHIDLETKIKFTRWIKLPNGEWHERIEYGIYRWSDAVIAGLVSKDVWKKYPSIMLYWRAYSKGARRIADDILLGVYEKTELMDATGIHYDAEDVDYLDVSNK